MRKTVILLLMLIFYWSGVVDAQDTSGCEAGTTRIEHALGITCVPADVERVVALEWTYVENLLALGVQPVGVADIEGYNNWVDISVELSEDTIDVGTRQEPNLELIAELEPDLILTASFRSANNYDELSAIAPTIAFNRYPDPESGASQYDEMLATFMTIANVLGLEDVGDQVIADLDATFAAAQSALEEAGRADETFILSQGWIANDTATFRLFTDNAMAVQVLERIGLENAWDDAPQPFGFTEISFEGFAGIEDTNFFYVAQGDVNEAFAASPLWNSLPFVQSDRAYYLGGDVWLFGGPLSAELLVETILDALNVEIPGATEDAQAAFPVTIEHKFGTTTIEEAPERVVAIGYTEQDYLVALGVIPIAVRSWYADESIAFLPWAEDEAGGATPEILVMPFGNLNYEAILALNPDMISAVTAGITQEEYETLSQIAPTIAQSGDYVDFGMPWQEITRTIGAAVGQLDAAEELISEVETRFAEAREANPEFAGQTIVVAYNYGDARTYGYYTAQDGRGRFFTDLGFVIPDELNEIAGESFFADISTERIDLLDQDVLIFLGLGFAEGGQEAIENDPLIQQLDVFKAGNVVFIPAEYDDALQYSSVLSLEFALEGIVPELAAIFNDDGN